MAESAGKTLFPGKGLLNQLQLYMRKERDTQRSGQRETKYAGKKETRKLGPAHYGGFLPAGSASLLVYEPWT